MKQLKHKSLSPAVFYKLKSTLLSVARVQDELTRRQVELRSIILAAAAEAGLDPSSMWELDDATLTARPVEAPVASQEAGE